MDESLKKRLIGAVVLVSLAVIFVPMLVEDEPVVSSHISDTNIPPRPELQSVDLPGDAVPPGDTGGTSGQNPQTYALPLPESVQNAPSSVPTTPVPAPVADVADTAAPPPPPPEPEIKPEITPKPAPAPTAAPAPKPAPAPAATAKPLSPGSWVVQVGSFSDKANADALSARLRTAGYEAFQDDVRVGDKVLYRVRVGPEADRQRAEKLQADILSSLKLNGQVRSHP